MKKTMYKISALAVLLIGTNACTTQSAISGTEKTIGVLGGVQKVLNTGVLDIINIFSNKDSFLGNALVESAMPKELKTINEKLTAMGLNDVVTKEKDLISKIAKETTNVAQPILKDAIDNITAEEALAIVSGGKGAATNFLKNKTQSQLISKLNPVINGQVDKLGISNLLGNALGGGNNNALASVLGSVIGNATQKGLNDKLSTAVSEQLVNSMFKIVENQETQARNNILKNIITPN